jgi:hypothetical protein
MPIVQIVEIKELIPIYKNGEEALSIQLAKCVEHDFDVIVQKNLYQIGDNAIYIQPDYCLPILDEKMTEAQKLFLSFTQPEGDPKKSKLGQNGRIRAIKFSFSLSKEDSIAGINCKIYSVGILLPHNKVSHMLNELEDLDKIFEITKYEEPETAYSGLSKGSLPSGMYRTDEENFKNQIRDINLYLPCELVGTVKKDGSSATVYYKNIEEFGICSRTQEKKLEQVLITNYTNENNDIIRKHYSQEKNKTIWLNVTTNESFDEPQSDWKEITKEVDDTFVKLGKPILDRVKTFCVKNNLALSFRFEMIGNGLKGSGNKNNPDAKGEQKLVCYGVDDFSSGVTRKLSYDKYVQYCTELNIEMIPVVFNKLFNSVDEIKTECENYFNTNLIEGIVIRNLDSTFSAKYMNNEYDSKK